MKRLTRDDAERFIAQLDNLEARSRDVETAMKRIRRELQDAYCVKTWDYDPAKPAYVLPRANEGRG